VDALDESPVDAHADDVVRHHGTLDVSMNLVSTGDVQGTPLVEMQLADFDGSRRPRRVAGAPDPPGSRSDAREGRQRRSVPGDRPGAHHYRVSDQTSLAGAIIS
jgi:hypothetical protein